MDADGMAKAFADDMKVVCRAAMPRAQACPRRRQVYWWTQEIADLRATSMRARRVYLRCRRRATSISDEEAELRRLYKAAKKALRVAIYLAKRESWERFIALLDEDPWGRPYRLVRGKFSNPTTPISAMEEGFVDRVLDALFPNPGSFQPPIMVPPRSRPEETTEAPLPVSGTEFDMIRNALRAKRTAPGPDGVPAKVLALALGPLGERFRAVLDLCIATTSFPRRWKDGRLVLLRKEGRPADSPSGYRPIVVLDEAGKCFEKILACRIVKHLEGPGPNLEDNQFGFRTGRSTVDAVALLKRWTEAATAQGEFVVAVSLDIRNAFNSLPHECIIEALEFHRVPPYLRAIVEDYLQDRSVLYEGPDGRIRSRLVAAGVPQGSVLGPLLWNLGYNWVLRGSQLPNTEVVCFADDTLVAAKANTVEEAEDLASVATALVVRRIRLLGLEVALDKSRAIIFRGPRRTVPSGLRIWVEGIQIPVEESLKYLGLVLDPRWRFEEHFKLLSPRLTATAAALGRVLPNIGGPNSACRRLYQGVVRSMALYGAPIWAECLKRRTVALLRRPQRTIATRAVRAYRTVSHSAACVLAGQLPWDIDARLLANSHRRRVEARELGQRLTAADVRQANSLARSEALHHWDEALAHCDAGHWTVEAFRPLLEEWVGRRRGSLTFRMVQVMTGHGCFGHYLYRVARREETPRCHHCDAFDDTAEHTLLVCPAWRQQRGELIVALGGGPLSLQTMVEAMLCSNGAWEAAVSFCENVMSQKEAAEREREDDAHANPSRRRRSGRRRGTRALAAPP